MSRLNDLLHRLDQTDAALAKDLRREVEALTERRAFGLNFERHAPEAVELPGRPVRRGDKVRVLPPRGSKIGAGDQRLWRVTGFTRTADDARAATLQLIEDETEANEALVDDLVVVAEFRDPIYPGLVSTGKVERGGEKPYHAVINAENYHALQTLLFTHRGKVDAIYIDPPYNTGAKDWKYNNDYVEDDDLYRHSKWLAFMERRLTLARDLLNPDDSVLIVTIDEKEFLRLGLLLEQTFPWANIQMISSVINPGGSVRRGAFSRTDEYIFVVRLGDAEVIPLPLGSEWRGGKSTSTAPVAWRSLLRGGDAGRRRDRPNMFYPIFVHSDGSGIHSAGAPIPLTSSAEAVVAPAGTFAVWPRNPNGDDGRWRVSVETTRANLIDGFVRANYKAGSASISYLAEGFANAVRNGEIETGGLDDSGVVILGDLGVARIIPGTAWNLTSHNSRDHGSALIAKLLPGNQFPFPKSLYAVEDVLRFFVHDKPEALVLDFFAGSGTTAHAVARLNAQHGGRRRTIVVTNNEVSADLQRSLRAEKLRPGDAAWERHGICDSVTKPRLAAAISGTAPNGDALKGDYKFPRTSPLSLGFDENIEFFTLTYEAPLSVSSHRDFAKVAPLFWLRAGSQGRRIDDVAKGWDVAETYGVLADLNQAETFVAALAASDSVRLAFIVTDEDRVFESIVRELPEHVEPVRLYEAYLQNFEIETSRSAL